MKNSTFEEIKSALIPGKRYTFFKLNSFGFPVARHVTLNRAEVTPYAQHRETLVIYFKPRGARTVKGFRVTESEGIYFWNGWVDIAADMFNGGNTSFNSFSEEYSELALDSIEDDPFIAHF